MSGDASVDGYARSSRARGDLELGEDVAQMTFIRLLTQARRSCYLAVAVGLRHQPEDFHFAPGQTSKRAPSQAPRTVYGRTLSVARERVRHGPGPLSSRALRAGDRGGGLTKTAHGNSEPALESVTVLWKRRGPDGLAQGRGGLGQTYGTPGLGRCQCPGEAFDAVGGRQMVARLPSESEALRKRRARASGITLSQRVLRQEIERPHESPTDAQLAAGSRPSSNPLPG